MAAIDYVIPRSEKMSGDRVAYHVAHLRDVAREWQYPHFSLFNTKVRLGV
jgi:hypothetical protein